MLQTRSSAPFKLSLRVTAHLEHPGVVPVHNASDDVLVMRRIGGRPFGTVMRDEGTDLATCVEILIKAAETIAYAHDQGVVHRDIKPDNIMVGDFGEVLVLDWGLAVSVPNAEQEDDVESQAGRFVPTVQNSGLLYAGTPAYMPPEMAAGRADAIGTATDVFCLGAVLYEMMAGRAPYHKKHVSDTLLDAMNTNYPELAELSPDAPEELRSLQAGAMTREPSERLALTAFIQGLRNWVRNSASERQARAFLTQAQEACDRAESLPGAEAYPALADAMRLGEQAQALWSQGGQQQRDRARSLYAQRALDLGDLHLAHAVVGEESAHQDLREHIGHALEERRQRAVQRRSQARWMRGLGIAAILLLLGAMAAPVMDGRWQERRRQEAAQSLLTQAHDLLRLEPNEQIYQQALSNCLQAMGLYKENPAAGELLARTRRSYAEWALLQGQAAVTRSLVDALQEQGQPVDDLLGSKHKPGGLLYLELSPERRRQLERKRRSRRMLAILDELNAYGDLDERLNVFASELAQWDWEEGDEASAAQFAKFIDDLRQHPVVSFRRLAYRVVGRIHRQQRQGGALKDVSLMAAAAPASILLEGLKDLEVQCFEEAVNQWAQVDLHAYDQLVIENLLNALRESGTLRSWISVRGIGFCRRANGP